MIHVTIARIGSPHGLKGELKVHSYTDPIENILNFKYWLFDDGDQILEKKVNAIKQQGKSFIVQLEGINTRDQAEKFINKSIKILRSDLAEIPPGEYYYHDLENLAVYNLQQEYLGIVNSCFTTGANDILEVVDKDRQIFIPFIFNKNILHVDLQKRTLLVDWEIL